MDRSRYAAFVIYAPDEKKTFAEKKAASLQAWASAPAGDWEPSQGGARERLYWHVAKKGFQVGSVLGLATALPVAYFRAGRNLSTQGALRVLAASATLGAAASVAMAVSRIASLPPDEQQYGMDDRSYRIHHNAGQNAVDTFTLAGAAAAAVAAAVAAGPSAASVLGGAAIGTAGGLAFYAATAPKKERGAPSPKF